MGFSRLPKPHVIEAAKGVPVTVSRFIGEREIAQAMAGSDPFGIADLCEQNPTGEHVGIGSCGHVVCCYCSRIFGG